jgi:N6-adenosine-specific RNA methylase IME4
MSTPALPASRFGAILADPPWSFATWSDRGKGRSAEKHYQTVSLAEISALPVAGLAADDCVLFLWATMPMLPQALAVIRAWRFQFKTCGFTWVKLTKDGDRYSVGMGYWTRSNSELCLLATRGKPKRLDAGVAQVIAAPRREHSCKPEEAAARIERLVTGPYIELFARRTRPGWTSWGNEVGKLAAPDGSAPLLL